MHKRLQALLPEAEMAEIQKLAKRGRLRQRMGWLRAYAKRDHTGRSIEPQSKLSRPLIFDMDQMLTKMDRG